MENMNYKLCFEISYFLVLYLVLVKNDSYICNNQNICAMKIFHRETAEKFINTCQYLKGKEVVVRRTDGSVAIGSVKSIGAFSWYPKNPKSHIELYANIKAGKGALIKVDLYDLYKALPQERKPYLSEQSELPEIGG